jgi:serpin B
VKPDDDSRLSEAVARYAASAPRVEWILPSDLRRHAVSRRHRRRLALGSTGSLLLAVCVGVTLALPSSAPARRPATGTRTLASNVERTMVAPGSPSELAVESGEQRFALELTQKVLSTGQPGNVVLSPESVESSLAMLELGARGVTQRQIAGVLGSSKLSATKQAAGWDALTSELASDARKSGGELTSENAVFVQRTLAVRPKYLDELKQNFGVGVEQVDFQAGRVAATRAINTWVKGATSNRIPQVIAPSSLPAQTSLVLADATQFSARWKWMFAKSQTTLGSFQASKGNSVKVPMMHLEAELSYFSTHGLEGVVLPYAGGKFDAIVVEPRAGSLTPVVEGLTPATLATLAAAAKVEPVTLALPKFSISSAASLDGSLQALGLGSVFTASADLSGISATPLMLGAVAQRDVVSVDESGTDATAASTAVVVPLGLHGQVRSISFDHPFLFVIRDNATGAILTDAVVTDPSQS